MSSIKYVAILLLAGNAMAAGGDFMIGAGVESDSESGRSVALMGGVGLAENTWLSGGLARSSVELASGHDLESNYADIELDHYFDPVGVSIGASYWRGSDILESQDWRASIYWRGNNAMLAGEYEFRDFNLTTPGTDFLASREILFDAKGIGATARFDLSEKVSLKISGKKYDYSVPFRPIESRDVIDLISSTRLSLINSLVDYRAGVSLGIAQGSKHWNLDLATWEGAVDSRRTTSVTLRYLMPMTAKTDIEFGLGRDDSELYGDVMFFSLHIFYYAGD